MPTSNSQKKSLPVPEQGPCPDTKQCPLSRPEAGGTAALARAQGPFAPEAPPPAPWRPAGVTATCKPGCSERRPSQEQTRSGGGNGLRGCDIAGNGDRRCVVQAKPHTVSVAAGSHGSSQRPHGGTPPSLHGHAGAPVTSSLLAPAARRETCRCGGTGAPASPGTAGTWPPHEHDRNTAREHTLGDRTPIP